jgi:hypothetical protein
MSFDGVYKSGEDDLESFSLTLKDGVFEFGHVWLVDCCDAVYTLFGTFEVKGSTLVLRAERFYSEAGGHEETEPKKGPIDKIVKMQITPEGVMHDDTQLNRVHREG